MFHGGYDCAGRPPSPINRMQNLVAHHDDKINDDLMWQALIGRVLDLIRQLGLTRPI